MTTTLLIVDTQPTFCEGGGLPVEGGNDLAARIGAYVADHGDRYDLVVASQDWHIDPGDHWAPESDEPDFATTWPRHGEAGTAEAELHPAMLAELDRHPRGRQVIDATVRKGMRAAAYSAFEGVVVQGAPEDAPLEPTGPGLAAFLRDHDVRVIDVVGIATDHCVRMSVLDAVREGFDVRVLTDLVVGVAPDTTVAALEEMAEAGAEVTTADAVGAAR